MSSVRSRENTFKVDLNNFPKRPTFEEIHAFVHETIGLRLDQVVRFQMNHAQNCAHVKCVDLQTAQVAVEQHDDKHEMVVNGKRVRVRLAMDDGGVEIKVHDLSENVSNGEIEAFLQQFGEVLSIRETIWGPNFAYKGVSSGVRVAKMILRRHIKSFVTIQGEQTLISYRNQPHTCKHCTELSHPGSTCVQNRKLLGQKVDLNERLKKAQSTAAPSYAGVLSKPNTQPDPSTSLLPQFVLTNLNALNEQEKRNNNNTDNVDGTLPSTEFVDTNSQANEQAATAAIGGATNGETSMDITEADERDPIETEMSTNPALSAPSGQQPASDATASVSTVSTFKVPNNPLTLQHIPLEISDSETGDSSNENGFQKVKRSKNRSKKIRVVSPPFNMLAEGRSSLSQ